MNGVASSTTTSTITTATTSSSMAAAAITSTNDGHEGSSRAPTATGGVTLERRRSSVQQAASVTTDATRRMVCGGLAGMIAKTATNPLERIKMLSQTGEHSASGRKTSVIRLYRDIIRNEGVRGLWAGNGANLIRVFPAKAVVFSSNDMYKATLRKWSNTPPDQQMSGSLSFLAGGLSGMTASACTYPLDFARGRISGKLGVAGKSKQYGGIIQTIVLTVKDEGILALYKGMTPTLMGAMPYVGIQFGTVGLLERAFPRTNETEKPSPFRKMMFGGMGGVMAGLIMYPNDTVRRILQVQGSRGTTHQYSGYWDCVLKTYKAEGVARFYRGCLINIVRMAPNTAVQFGSYELLKQYTADWHL